jgi:SAM-dependent methyltransferase
MWDARYSEPGWAYGTEPNEFLVAQVATIPLGAVLCIGDGEGRNGVWLATRGYDVTSLDASEKGLEKARGLAKEKGVTIATVAADLETYAFEPARWSGIVSIWCHLPRALRRRVHHACVAALRPGGVFVLEAYTPSQVGRNTGGPKSTDFLATLAELREELAGLDFELGLERVREVHEGRHHDGLSDVVQVVARKSAT